MAHNMFKGFSPLMRVPLLSMEPETENMMTCRNVKTNVTSFCWIKDQNNLSDVQCHVSLVRSCYQIALDALRIR